MKRRRDENDGENWGPSNWNDAGPSNTRALDDQTLEDMLDTLDREADPSSNEGDNVSASDPVLEPKHEIFLSHSGKQKDFTELLCRELERWGYSPFFDVREDSLPKGKKFPELIFRAARQCRVAVLILSEEFFTNTKWPMLELAAFVDAQERNAKQNLATVDILPVYFKLTREECRKDENVKRWQKRWEAMEGLERAENMREMDELGRAELGAKSDAAGERRETRSEKWKDALNVFGPSIGIEYERSSRQAGLIDRVVSAIRGLLPPPNMASDPSTQANGRICKTLIGMISKTTVSANGVRVVGVYGVGGIGKTTFCKELCCVLYKRFEGKVCHAELGKLPPSELQREVVQKLTDVNKSSLSCADASKITEHLRTRMVGDKVFLALDNVWPETTWEAKVYVEEAHYGHGSIVMVTARSIDILLSLNIMRDNCFAMPELEEEDARRLFLHHAGLDFHSESIDDEECIRHCVYACHFCKGGNAGMHFLPLALKVLGQQMHGSKEKLRKWVMRLSMKEEFDLDRENASEIFYILGRGYDLLRAEDQCLFIDAVLCKSSWNLRYVFSKCCTLFEWLSIVHYGTLTKEALIRDRLEGLKARALLEDVGDGVDRVHAHDLYVEFAKFEASRGGLDKRRVVWHEDITDLPMELVKTPSGTCWSNVERVVVKFKWMVRRDLRWMEGLKWQHFANVVVLVLTISEDQVLDLRGLQCLRSLTIDAVKGTLIGLGELRNLRWLDLRGIHCSSCFGEIGDLRELEMLRVRTNCTFLSSDRTCKVSPTLGLPNVHKCINLRWLDVTCRCFGAWPDLGGMTFLRKVQFRCPNATEGPAGLGSQLSELQELRLSRNSFRNCLPQLHEVVSLQELDVSGFRAVDLFADIHMLTRLRTLSIEYLPKLVQLPELGGLLTRLSGLTISGCHNLVELPELGGLVALKELEVDDLPKVVQLPELGGLLTRLSRLTISRCHNPVELPELGGLVALRILELDDLPKVVQLPELGGLLTRLSRLTISRCHNLVELPELGGLVALEILNLDDLPKVVQLPELGGLLTRLWLLTILRCLNLVELPELGGLVALQLLELYDLPKVVQLPELGGLLTRLRDVTISRCHNLVELPELGGLVALQVLKLDDLPKMRELPNMRLLTTLQEISVRNVGKVWEHPRSIDMVPSQLCYFNEHPLQVLYSNELHAHHAMVEDTSWFRGPLDPREWYCFRVEPAGEK